MSCALKVSDVIPESFIVDRPTALKRRPGYGVIARYRDWLPCPIAIR